MPGPFGYRLAIIAAATLLSGEVARAQKPELQADMPRLSVVGEGVARAAPDMATVTMGVVSEAPHAREALSANTDSMQRILDALKAAGVAPRDLQTSGFTVEPIYSQPPRDFDGSQPFEPQIVGYRVRNEVTVRVRDLAKTGEILDQTLTLGANSVSGPTFTVADPAPLEDKARRAAVEDAMRKATLYAGAARVTLGPIARIEENVTEGPQPIPLAAMAREKASDAAVPVEGGEIAFQAQVAITWRIAE